jgi:hypothetical protein
MSELINNREQRIRHLKEIILHLHQGLPEAQVKARLAEIVQETDAGEIAAMEQQLMADGLGVDEIKSMCDLHAQVTRDLLREPPHAAPLPDGHPIPTFRAENRALERVIAGVRADVSAMTGDAATLERLQAGLHELMDVDKHYRRKEQLLFPLLERHGVTAPSQVMWAKDDEVREALKVAVGAVRAARAGSGPGEAALATAVEAAIEAVEGMIYKEEKILLPMAADLLTEEEWGELWLASPGTGWCLVEPGRDYRPPVPAAPAATAAVPGGAAVAFPTGTLTIDQLLGIFSTLPVDLTFVDADDRVAFFSSGRDRVFERPLTVLGRQVHHCHPPRSVHIVERILADFRAGRQEVAEFWLELSGKFVHIRYFPVRDPLGAYLGTLEVTQDLTRPRALTGERRLLAYDEAAGPGSAAVAPSADISALSPSPTTGPAGSSATDAVSPPAWFDPTRIDTVIDAAPLLAAGEHPVMRVRTAGAALPPGRILALQTGFVPEPLVAMMLSDGFQAWTRPEGPGRFTTFFCRGQ